MNTITTNKKVATYAAYVLGAIAATMLMQILTENMIGPLLISLINGVNWLFNADKLEFGARILGWSFVVAAGVFCAWIATNKKSTPKSIPCDAYDDQNKLIHDFIETNNISVAQLLLFAANHVDGKLK